jgi:hypothetical protein
MRREKTRVEDERAVSEAVSYVLIFGLITTGTVLVALQGGPAITNTQDEQLAENVQRAAVLLQDRVDEMVRQQAPSREVSLDVQDIRVGVGDMEPARFNITTTDTSGDSTQIVDTETDPVYIQKTAGNIDLTAAYVNGAVLVGQRGRDETWTMASRPSWAIRTNSSTGEVGSIFMSTVATEGSSSVSGQGVGARILFERISQEGETLSEIDEVSISVDSPRSDAWEEYFRRLNGSINGSSLTAPSTPGGTVTLVMDEFEDGEGRMSHRSYLIGTEVSSR